MFLVSCGSGMWLSGSSLIMWGRHQVVRGKLLPASGSMPAAVAASSASTDGPVRRPTLPRFRAVMPDFAGRRLSPGRAYGATPPTWLGRTVAWRGVESSFDYEWGPGLIPCSAMIAGAFRVQAVVLEGRRLQGRDPRLVIAVTRCILPPVDRRCGGRAVSGRRLAC